jgi:hypothetical protein
MVGVRMVEEFLTAVGEQVGIGGRDREDTKRIEQTDAAFDAKNGLSVRPLAVDRACRSWP